MSSGSAWRGDRAARRLLAALVTGRALSGPPAGIEPPDEVHAIAGGGPLVALWRNALGGLTFRAGDEPGARVIKWSPRSSGIDLMDEAARMRWAEAFTRVPHVVEAGENAHCTWMVTLAIDAENAVAERWKREPATAVHAIGEGLRALHDALPVVSCPFDWDAEGRLVEVRKRAAHGLLDPGAWHSDFRGLSIEGALGLLADPPPIDRLVVCHGDVCAPNTLIGADGRWRAHVDMGSLGVADRWADLAIATWSTTWNYGAGWEDALLAAYGVGPDPERTAYYRLLWELGP